ncbi:MAG: alpha-L-rhamnosidase N-terminal domain-containing protein [Caldilineaceae bacterium]|nr:alpha-L-rhamnosidase N-terminal domain-containing protein [Caldilineaceae bacterium]
MLTPPPTTFWIGSDHPFDLHEAYICFRSPHFDWDGEATTLWITADSRYRLWVNGTFVARGPARSWPSRQAVDRVDIGALLHATGNVIAVQVYQPGYSHFSYVHRGAAALLAWLAGADGTPVLVSNTGWRVRRDPSFSAHVPRVSIYGSGVEDRDLRLDEPWQQPGYDDAGWSPARIVATTGDEIWAGLHARTVPTPAERVLNAPLAAVRIGSTSTATDVHLRLRAGWTAADDIQVSPDEDGWLAWELAAGQSAYLLYDLGRNYTCQGWLDVAGARGGEEVVVSYAEKIRAGELVISDPATYCRVRLTDRFVLRAGVQTAQGFTPRGGRYVIFHLVGPTGPDLRIRPRVTVAEYPLTVTKPLHLDDPVLDGVVAMCETTLRACLQETFVDCCWRESSQWLGDALPQARLLASMSDDLRPLRQVLVMAAQGAYPDGILPSILPGEVHAYAVLDYNFTWVELLALWRELNGPAGDALLMELWPTLVNLLDAFHTHLGDDGLLRAQPGRRLFLDWAPLSRAEPNALYNLRYLWALQVAIGLGEEIGDWATERLGDWRARTAALAEEIRRAFLVDGVWYDDRERATFSQHAAAFAVLTGCATPDEVPALLDAIVARSLDPSDDSAPNKMVLASPFMQYYVFEALQRHGRDADIRAIIRLRWGRWVEQGERTTWENWNVDFPDGSICHAFSAHPRYFLMA